MSLCCRNGDADETPPEPAARRDGIRGPLKYKFSFMDGSGMLTITDLSGMTEVYRYGQSNRTN
jgi:hypothetical protein